MKKLSRCGVFFVLFANLLLWVGLAGCRPEAVVLPTPILPALVEQAPVAVTLMAQTDRPPTPPVTPAGAVPLPSPTAVSPNTPLSTTGWRVSADPTVPDELRQLARQVAQAHPDRFTWVDEGGADVTITAVSQRPFFTWVYAAAAPFPTLADATNLAALQDNWRAAAPPLLVSADTAALFQELWGEPGTAVQIIPAAQLAESLWAQRPAQAILPFERLQPELKLLRLADASPVSVGFDPAAYPLTIPFGFSGDETAVADLSAVWNAPTSNYDPGRLTRIALTGVTALVRATAYNMEQRGILWPGEEVGPILQTADIAHISNEVAFAPDCPYPNPIGGTTFCSRDGYFALLEHLGTDVVELTGNHLNDWGAENLVRTIDMYEAAGMATYGGGRDGATAAQPALFTHNGNRIAFVGCNSFGPNYAWATAASAGSRPCDGTLPPQIRQLADEGYLVIATLQYTEFYQYAPTPQQVVDFQALAEAGATAVSGSQAHHVQGFAFHQGSFIHYGPGNLFFDQMDMLGTRQAFVDTYAIYDGRLLNVDLWTGLIENYARPRQMTPEERAAALTAVFQASGW